MAQETVAQRFNQFHLEVAIYAERCEWVLARMDDQDQGVWLLRDLLERLEGLLAEQYCGGSDHASR